MSAAPLNDKFQDTVLFTTIYPTPNTMTVQQFKEHTGIGTQKVELAMEMNTKKWQKTENKWCIYLYLSHQIEIIYCAAFNFGFIISSIMWIQINTIFIMQRWCM